MKTSRSSFNNSWLFESPKRMMPSEMFSHIKFDINSFKKYKPVLSVSGRQNFYKIVGEQTALYWYEDNKELVIGIKFEIKNQNYTTEIIGKNEKWSGKYPFASDLYDIVLKDIGKSIVMSDFQMTEQGFNVWKQLFLSGHKISIYNTSNPGGTFKTFDSIQEMENFFGDDPKLGEFQYVLTENGPILGETISFFNTRRFRELCGFDLED